MKTLQLKPRHVCIIRQLNPKKRKTQLALRKTFIQKIQNIIEENISDLIYRLLFLLEIFDYEKQKHCYNILILIFRKSLMKSDLKIRVIFRDCLWKVLGSRQSKFGNNKYTKQWESSPLLFTMTVSEFYHDKKISILFTSLKQQNLILTHLVFIFTSKKIQ